MVLRRVLLFSSLATTFAVFGLSGPTAAANPAQGPIFGIAKGTTEVNLDTGAGTTVNQGFLLGIGLFKGNSSSTFAYTGPNTFSSTGSGTLVTANGNELFITSVGTGTLSGTAVNATTVDTITGGTGRFEGASGHITIYARGTFCLNGRIQRDLHYVRPLGRNHQLPRRQPFRPGGVTRRDAFSSCSGQRLQLPGGNLYRHVPR